MMIIARAAASPLAVALRGMAELPLLWLHRARSRRHLRDLDARTLADVGLSETQRRTECARCFWQGEIR